MITCYVQPNPGQRARKAGVTVFKGLGNDSYGGRLIDSEDNEQPLRSMLLSQPLYLLLYRKTYGAGSSSDETGGGFINDLGTGGRETGGDRCPENVIPFSKDDGFFSF